MDGLHCCSWMHFISAIPAKTINYCPCISQQLFIAVDEAPIIIAVSIRCNNISKHILGFVTITHMINKLYLSICLSQDSQR